MIPVKYLIRPSIASAQRNLQRVFGANTKTFTKKIPKNSEIGEIEELDQYLSEPSINPESSAKMLEFIGSTVNI